MAGFNGKNSTTLWAKHKVKRSKRTNEEYECFEGSIDTGSGKMITVQIYANQEPKELKDGTHAFPVQIRKWKGTPRQNRSNKSW